MDLASCQCHGAHNFEATPTFLDNLYTPAYQTEILIRQR